MITYNTQRRRRTCLVVAASALVLAACSGKLNDALLQATDPDIIDPSVLQNADGAEGLRIGTISRLNTLTAAAPGNAEGVWFMGGLLVDEWKSGDTFTQRDETDRRIIAPPFDNSIITAGYRYIHRTRISANLAIDGLRKFKPTPAANIAQMYFIRAYAELLSGENFCNGQPFSDGSQGDVIQEGTPQTVLQALQRAVSSADSAIGTIGAATDAQSVNILNATKLVKARALMSISTDNFAAAKATVAGVSTAYAYNVGFSQNATLNGIWALNNNAKRYVVGDSVDATGVIRNSLPFKSAKDPRVPTSGTGRAFDSTTPFTQQLIWASTGSPAGSEDVVAVVNGIDARLIEAEVALFQGDVAGWLGILNTLRTGPTQLSGAVPLGVTIAGMAPLADPGSAGARVSLQFREKAFWTFARGERLGDARRLIREYGRPQDQVFPVGTFHKGGAYGTDVNLPVPQAEENNTLFKGCTDRNA